MISLIASNITQLKKNIEQDLSSNTILADFRKSIRRREQRVKESKEKLSSAIQSEEERLLRDSITYQNLNQLKKDIIDRKICINYNREEIEQNLQFFERIQSEYYKSKVEMLKDYIKELQEELKRWEEEREQREINFQYIEDAQQTLRFFQNIEIYYEEKCQKIQKKQEQENELARQRDLLDIRKNPNLTPSLIFEILGQPEQPEQLGQSE
ncbi:hypothetical protein PPERSA_01969 [Pseudocohnilembus persalinus]|uniref:Uncharacterized protein n=1 Tax=Pseudocohnilembus persalinus TaxID=266149 RepID=A0A0V0R3W8_PSEPJ|nr:hypothetical protein PPERSA_01969 [Pseudocohnilembus persalinus]|eukprot:KRX09082.1 hypothetical protein PPERSA_01969 [Pseudocohnilembus persalinus]